MFKRNIIPTITLLSGSIQQAPLELISNIFNSALINPMNDFLDMLEKTACNICKGQPFSEHNDLQ